MKTFLKHLLQLGGIIITLLAISFFRILIQDNSALQLRRLIIISVLWAIVGAGVYKLSVLLTNKNRFNSNTIKFVGWLNLFAWIVGLLGVAISSSTLALANKLPNKQKKFFLTLASINLLFSVFNLIGGVFQLDVFLATASFGIIIIYPLTASLIYFLAVSNKTNRTKTVSDRQNNAKPSNKNIEYFLTLIVLVFALGSLFYWYQVRPTNIRKECSWVKHHSDAVRERPAMTEQELRNKGLLQDCSAQNETEEYLAIFGDSAAELCEKQNQKIIDEYSVSKPSEPERNWADKSTDQEYTFCIRSKGLSK